MTEGVREAWGGDAKAAIASASGLSSSVTPAPSSFLFLDAVGVSGDSMADGFALSTGIGYLMPALLVHLAAAVAFGVSGVRRWVNSS
jgi:hypothetical protein